jgi:DNA-binding CsgD family transcriptional regulator
VLWLYRCNAKFDDRYDADMTNPASETLNRLIDAVDLLDKSFSPDDAWTQSIAIAQFHGFNAINIMEVDAASGGVTWFRSSMQMQWLTDYMAQDFMGIDPLIVGACMGKSKMRMVEGEVVGTTDIRQKSPELGNQLLDWGYRSLETRVFASEGAGYIKGVTVSRPDIGPETGRDHDVLCALIKAAVGPPESPDSPGTLVFMASPLTLRETDVLCYLAAGLRNDAIAWKLGIAEVTVRAHVTSARQKLGASTREEAIAIAVRERYLPI